MNNILSLVKNIFYKLKNPLKVLYVLMCAGVVFVAVYVLFVYAGSAGMMKRLLACIMLSLLLLAPLFIKLVIWFLHKHLQPLLQNRSKCFFLFIAMALGLAVLLGLTLPSSVIASSVQEFSNIGAYKNPSAFLGNPFLQSIGVFLFWPTCIYFLFNKPYIQTLICAIFSMAFFSAAANAYMFAGNYGSMDASLQFIGGMHNPSAVFLFLNFIVVFMLCIFVLTVIKYNKLQALSLTVCVFVCSFIIVTFFNVHEIKKEYREFERISKNNFDSEKILIRGGGV